MVRRFPHIPDGKAHINIPRPPQFALTQPPAMCADSASGASAPHTPRHTDTGVDANKEDPELTERGGLMWCYTDIDVYANSEGQELTEQ